MITHVAEAGEDRGRVVFNLGTSGRLSDVAMEAALRVAQAFHSEIEALFVEDQQLFDLLGFSFSHEIAFPSSAIHSIDPAVLEREMRLQGAALSRRVLIAAGLSDIRARARTIREDPVRALALACAEVGPWNVVALGEPLAPQDATLLPRLFREVDAATGFVVTGRKACRTGGPVVAIVEEADRVPGMLRAAERLAAVTGGEAQLWLLEEGSERLEWLEGQVRLSLGLKARAVRLVPFDASRTDMRALCSSLQRIRAGFVIARHGGRLAPHDEADPIALSALEGPLFLVR